ncbi:MAG: TVP38/TMEM64 family protein [Candidatus Diapherotrites archaeon]|uniref:TVP38/TMEM64 family protein n=1 Tax=Candidatus Iainarchaeum sp. TaxID=3101447 RepID=A0A8T4C7B8_9ARCH|nr:TVP38/TMEM64 family protein [Candidatus Diapherotrites archaeon]
MASFRENVGPIIFLAAIGSITLIPILFPDISAPLAHEIQSYVVGFGVWGPVAMIGLMILATIFSPIPNSFITLTIGATYGVFFGSILALIGAALASSLAFFLSRKFGKKFVEKYIPHTHFIHSFFKDNAFLTIFILRIIPSVSFDMISYGAGLTSMRWKTFALGTFLGIIPGTISVVLVGAGLTEDSTLSWWGVGLYAVLIIAGAILTQRLNLLNGDAEKNAKGKIKEIATGFPKKY